MGDLAQVIDLLGREDAFLLTTHLHPDGDGLGSMFALRHALAERGKKAAMVLTECVPGPYIFLDGAADILHELPTGFGSTVLIALDCGDKDRMAIPSIDGDITIVNIDHHLSNRYFGAINLVDPQASATGELVYKLLISAGYPINHNMGTALYIAIATDTGFFRYTNATREAFILAANLVESFALDPGKIAEIVHEQKTLNAVKLLGEVLGTLTLAVGGKVAWMYLNQAMLARYPVELEETEGFVNYARSIIGAEIALFLKETREDEVRVSWRSGPGVDVSQLAAYFGGGGHARAAGCTLLGQLAAAVKQVLDFLTLWYEGRGS